MSPIISWNCQGLGRALTIQKLRELIRSHSPSVVFLCETKQQKFRVNNLRRQLRFNKGCTVEPSVHSAGGLALWWRPEVEVKIIFKSRNLLDTKIKFLNLNKTIRVSFFYAPPYPEDKPCFWSSLRFTHLDPDEAWICVGDFNELVSHWEKDGGIPWHWNRPRYLKSFMDHHAMTDLGFSGPKFTWDNRRDNVEEVIRERLDRAVGNLNFIHQFPDVSVSHEATVGSDHCPLAISLHPPVKKGPLSFRFEASWFSFPECENIIESCWGSPDGGNPVIMWEKNLISCKKKLLKWKKEQLPNCKWMIDSLSLELQQIQLADITDASRLREKEITMELGALWSQEESYWRQRSRISWLLEGDRNSKFFHLTTIIRRKRNRISSISLGNDVWISHDAEISLAFTSFFSNLYTSSGPRNWGRTLDNIHCAVSSDQNADLSKPFSISEIVTVTKQLGGLKAPGPDGFPGMFYSKYWNTVHENINQTVAAFYRDEISIDSLNKTNIVLIPKVSLPESVNQFRPISLCNNSAKILSKLLANRLKPVLSCIISEQQNAFVAGRQIQDNLIIAHEAYHYLKLKKSKSDHEMALKLDMNKAYDRVEWDFLEASLKKFGFDAGWIKLVMKLVTSVSFSIVINGKQTQSFKPSRGLRQGDPLSPYLFLIIGEVLSRNITCASESNLLTCMKLSPSCPGLSHLLFADDSIFFLKATMSNCNRLRVILEEYCQASGQSINLEKSSIYFSVNTPEASRDEIATAMNISVAEKPGIYLGLPTHWGNSKKKALAYVRERIQQKLEGWKANILSQAGREILIKAVAMAVPAYPMSIFLMPITLCKTINSDIANFWWGFSGEKGKIHWKAWDTLCNSKLDGGIGFKNLHTFNLALLGKQCWRLIANPGSLWGRILKARYFPTSSFLHAKKGSRPSWVWNSLLAGREVISANACWQVRDGKSIDVWKDRWVPNNHGGMIIPTTTYNRFTPLRVSEIFDSTNGWNISHLEPFLSDEDNRAIKAIPICVDGSEDRLVWPSTKTGDYSVKTGYYKMLDLEQKGEVFSRPSTSHHIDKRVWKLIWHPKNIPKVSNFLWRALVGALPVSWNLCKRKILPSSSCQICGEHGETAEHSLLLCPWTTAVWFSSTLGYVPDKQKITTLEKWLLAMSRLAGMSSYSPVEFFQLICFHLWEIWKHRCEIIMRGGKPNPTVVAMKINDAFDEWLKAHMKEEREEDVILSQPGQSDWSPPSGSIVKINVDGAWDCKNLESGLGIIIRNHNGISVAGASIFSSHNSVEEAEADAVLHGIQLAAHHNLRDLILECDSQTVVKALKEPTTRHSWRLSPLLSRINHLLPLFNSVCWSWIPRKTNRAADAAAKLAKLKKCSSDWTNRPPSSIMSVLRNDGLPGPPD